MWLICRAVIRYHNSMPQYKLLKINSQKFLRIWSRGSVLIRERKILLISSSFFPPFLLISLSFVLLLLKEPSDPLAPPALHLLPSYYLSFPRFLHSTSLFRSKEHISLFLLLPYVFSFCNTLLEKSENSTKSYKILMYLATFLKKYTSCLIGFTG